MYLGKGVEIDVDGAWVEGGGVGYGLVIRQDGEEVYRAGGPVPGDPDLLGHRQIGGEIYAVVEALRWCVRHKVPACTIYHDYEGLEAWATGRWKAKTPLTKRYVAFLRQVRDKVQITWVKVPAHKGHHWNEVVDQLARAGAARTPAPPPPQSPPSSKSLE
jgi:ribonuclease HI